MLMSLRCPVPIQGSLVTSTSPGLSDAGGNARRKCRTVTGSVPMNEGMLNEDCASEWPSASSRTQAKSLDSRTIVEKDVRTSVAEASSTMAISRFQRISRAIGSMSSATVRSLHLDVQGLVAVHRERRIGAHHNRRFTLLDERGSREALAWSQCIAIVDRRRDEPAALGEV